MGRLNVLDAARLGAASVQSPPLKPTRAIHINPSMMAHTCLNSYSSRSHCVFAIQYVKTTRDVETGALMHQVGEETDPGRGGHMSA